MSEIAQPKHPILELDGVHFGYGHNLLCGVSLKIRPGEIFCLLGPSGSGKSSLLRLISGLERCTSGSISLDGKVVSDVNTHLTPHKRNLALVFQDFGLFPHLSVHRNIELALAARGFSRTYIKETVDETIAIIEMADKTDKPCQLLSGGEQQRVALARALAVHPRLILLDEPFSNLDTRLRQDVRIKTLQLIKRHGISTLLVTHDAEEALVLADQMAILDQGCIQQYGTPDQIYNTPAHAGVAELLGHANTFAVKAVNGIVTTPLGTFTLRDKLAHKSCDMDMIPVSLNQDTQVHQSRTDKPNDHRNHDQTNKDCFDCIIKYQDLAVGEESFPRQLSSEPSAKIVSVRHVGSQSHIDCFLPYRESEGGWKLILHQPRQMDVAVGQWRKVIVDESAVLICQTPSYRTPSL